MMDEDHRLPGELVGGYDPHAGWEDRLQAIKQKASDLELAPDPDLIDGLETIARHDYAEKVRNMAQRMVSSYHLVGDFSLTTTYKEAMTQEDSRAKAQEAEDRRLAMHIEHIASYRPDLEEGQRLFAIVDLATDPRVEITPEILEDLETISENDNSSLVVQVAVESMHALRRSKDRGELTRLLVNDYTFDANLGIKQYLWDEDRIPINKLPAYEPHGERDHRLSALLAVGLSAPKEIDPQIVSDLWIISKFDGDRVLKYVAATIYEFYDSSGKRRRRKGKLTKAIESSMSMAVEE